MQSASAMTKPLMIRMPEHALGLVQKLAEQSGCASSTWARQTLYAALRAQGLDPVAMPTDGDAAATSDIIT